MNQRDLVLEYLRNHESISPMQAIEYLGITKLATIISLLIRKDGVAISKKPCKGINRFGKPTRYMEYRLEDKQE